MIDEPFAPEPAPARSTRAPYVIGGGAFLGGMLLMAGLFQLSGHGLQTLLPAAAPTIAPQPQPSAAPVPQPATDLATLNAREAELAGRLDQLAMRLRDVDGSARNASTYASRAEQLLIAAAVRRAIERGQPLGPLEAQLRLRFGEGHGEAVSAIVRAAAEPVTLGDLRLALDTISPRLLIGDGDSMWTWVRRFVGDLVVIRAADSPSPRASDRLRRARTALEEGQVEAALAEIAHMPGAANAESWVSAARRYNDARQGLSDIERAALEAPPATLPLPVPVQPPAPQPAGT